MKTKVKADLARVTARDLMQANVVQLEAAQPVQQAIEILEENRISGAPVIDGGRLVGTLSARDVARSDHLRGGRIADERGDYELAELDTEEPWEEEESLLARDGYSAATSGGATVRDWMNPAVVSVGTSASLGELCRAMAAEGNHRVLVVDDNKLAGLVAASDVVRYLAQTL